MSEMFKPYQSEIDLQFSGPRIEEGNMLRTERNLTHLKRYILKEKGRDRVNTDGITGRKWIGKRGLVRG